MKRFNPNNPANDEEKFIADLSSDLYDTMLTFLRMNESKIKESKESLGMHFLNVNLPLVASCAYISKIINQISFHTDKKGVDVIFETFVKNLNDYKELIKENMKDK